MARPGCGRQSRVEMTRMTHEGGVNAVAFSPDGRWVVSGSDDGTARVWLWQPQDIAALLCARLPRNFTQAEWRQFFGDVPYHPTCKNLPGWRVTLKFPPERLPFSPLPPPPVLPWMGERRFRLSLGGWGYFSEMLIGVMAWG